MPHGPLSWRVMRSAVPCRGTQLRRGPQTALPVGGCRRGQTADVFLCRCGWDPKRNWLSVVKAAGLFTRDVRHLPWAPSAYWRTYLFVLPLGSLLICLKVGGISCFRTAVLSKLFHLARRRTVSKKHAGMRCTNLMDKTRDGVI